MIFHHMLSDLGPNFGKGPQKGVSKKLCLDLFSAKGGSNKMQ